MPLEPIIVSPNGHYLTTQSGEPFFWLGDTAWNLFCTPTRAEAEHYLEVRRQQGFNVIQAVALGEFDGLRRPNANGHTPLLGDDPTRPDEYYFKHVDDIIRLAASKGLYIGLLPTWADKVNAELWGIGPKIFNVENAHVYGKFLGQRYKNDSNILWILGGDRPAAGYEDVWGAMASGIAEGLGHKPFMTYHPIGGVSTAQWLHDADWLDMNMWQSSHVLYDAPNWDMVASDYVRTPVKPVLDDEANYEGHPVDPFTRVWKSEYGRYNAYDIRKQAYRPVFAGACGHTYGHQSIWQFWTLKREPVNFPSPVWDEAIFAQGARQLIHLKNLMLSRPYLSRVPAQEMLLGLPEIPPPDNAKHYEPLRAAHPQATRNADGSYAMVYIPQANQTVKLDLSSLAERVNTWWYDPRNGAAYAAGEYPNEVLEFTTPLGGPDWVLVLDAVSAGFGEPGK